MEVGNLVYKNNEIILLEDLYLKDLRIINNIRFTDRDIDIIACIIGGRSYKKIAALLSISSKTVENYIRNIMLRLGCNSKERIIDFIEKSDKYLKVKLHYSKLLIQATFVGELNKNLPFTKNNVTCLLLSYNAVKNKNLFWPELKKHFSAAGITLLNKTINKEEFIGTIISESNIMTTDYIIGIVDDKLLSSLNFANNNNKKDDTSSLIQSINNAPNHIIFLSLTNTNFKIQENLSNIAIVNLFEHTNYYLLVFDLLKKMFPKHNIDQSINSFKAQYETLFTNLSLQPQIKYNNSAKKTDGAQNNYQYFKKFILIKSIVLVLATMLLSFGIFNFDKVPIIFHLINNTYNKTMIIPSLTNKVALINLPPRNNNFTGRKQSLEQISYQLNKQKLGIINQTITGLGGIGKTQLATEFAYQTLKEKHFAMIFWIPAETANAINNAYQEIANYLQLNVEGLELDRVQNLVHKKLASIYKNHRLLFILDNVPDYDNINNYLLKVHKELSPFLSPYILITSRSQYWPETPISLDTFTPKEALIFIKKYLPDENENNIKKLTLTLHYFPLALGQAAAYIKKHTNINDYLELYKAKQKEYLDTFPENKNQYNETLWKTWNIAVNNLSKVAKEILFIAAYLDPDDIPLNFFTNLSTEKKINGIEELRKYSFITMINNNQAFKVHRLLQEVIRLSINHNTKIQNNSLKTNTYWLNKSINLLQNKFEFDYLQPEKWKHWSKLLPQAQTLASHAITTSGKTLRQGLKLYIKYVMFLTCIQLDGKNAIAPWQIIKFLTSKHYNGQGKELIMANINTYLSYAQNYAGKYKDTKTLLDNTISIYEKPLPKLDKKEMEILDLLRIIPFKNNVDNKKKIVCDLDFALLILGRAQNKLGFMQDALNSYLKALSAFSATPLDKISQYYKIDTLYTTGRMYIYLGQFIDAEKILEKAQEGETQLYSSHPRLAHSYATLSSLRYQLGKYQESTELLSKCNEIREANFSPQHIQHADTNLKLGYTNYMLGKISKAINNFTQAEAIYKLYYDDNEAAFVFTNLGFWKVYEIKEEYTKARNFMNKTLTVAQLNYKNNINSGMAFQTTQAEIWPDLIKQQNLSYWQEALKTTEQIFGKTHYEAAKYYYMLGMAYELSHNFNKASLYYRKALILLNSMEIRHPKLKYFYDQNIKKIKEKLNKTESFSFIKLIHKFIDK